MQHRHRTALILAGLLLPWAPLALATPAPTQAPEPPALKMPEPGVPEVVTLKGKFLRVAYNDEGFVVVGYMSANRAIGGEWMLLDLGLTLLGETPDFSFRREAITLETPDGRTLPMATVNEQRGAGIEALQWRARRENPSIDYFPTFASQPCGIPFFADLDSGRTIFDEVELSVHRGCFGRIYFHVPGGIALGQYWLDVKLANSLVRVPFTILTPEEEKFLHENFDNIRQQLKEAFPPTM